MILLIEWLLFSDLKQRDHGQKLGHSEKELFKYTLIYFAHDQ